MRGGTRTRSSIGGINLFLVLLFSVLALLSIFELLALQAVTNGNMSQMPDALESYSNDGTHTRRSKVTVTPKKRRRTLPGGYQSPVDSMLNNFPNDAVETEVKKHDRWIVDSLAHINTFSADDAKQYTSIGPTASSPKLITMIILTVNRAVPYVAVTLSTLLRGHSPNTFMQYIDLHVINIERRPRRTPYTFFTDLERRLSSFIKFEDWQSGYKETEHIAKMNNPQALYMENQRIDIIRSLKICKERKSQWCLIIEDDAVFPVNFVGKFRTYVDVDKYENATLPGGPSQTYDSPPLDPAADNSTGPVYRGRVAMVKLYVPFNDAMVLTSQADNVRSGGNIKASDYSMDSYRMNAALDLYEAKDMQKIKVEYKIRASWTMYGGVANAFLYDKIDMLTAFLSTKKRMQAYPTDALLNYDLTVETKLSLLETHPSMVGHIGYYREHLDAGRGIGEISTDIRFQLDDGPQEEQQEESKKAKRKRVHVHVDTSGARAKIK